MLFLSSMASRSLNSQISNTDVGESAKAVSNSGAVLLLPGPVSGAVVGDGVGTGVEMGVGVGWGAKAAR